MLSRVTTPSIPETLRVCSSSTSTYLLGTSTSG
jgi:hypothetical protein